MRTRILGHVVRSGREGATAEEIAKALGLAASPVAAGIADFLTVRLIQDAGDRRQMNHGRTSIVWTATRGGGTAA